MDRDSLIAVATQGGFSLNLNQPGLLFFAPHDSAAASVQADLTGRRVSALSFQYPVIPTMDEFAAKEQEFTRRFGTPQGASDGDSSRIVLWQDEESRVVLKAGFSGRRGIPYVAKFFDLAALGAADQAADSTAKSAKKPVHTRKVHRKRTHPKAGS